MCFQVDLKAGEVFSFTKSSECRCIYLVSYLTERWGEYFQHQPPSQAPGTRTNCRSMFLGRTRTLYSYTERFKFSLADNALVTRC